MAARQKWDINGKGVAPGTGGFNDYNGPDLPKGSWPAKIKRMEITKIAAQGENHGKPRIRILLEVTGLKGDKAKYNGHPIWDGLNIIDGSQGFVNGFLHGLTDGSDAQKRYIEAQFWDEDKGPERRRVKVEKGSRKGQIEVHITKIGKVNINSPKGETIVQVTTRAGVVERGPNKGDYRAEVTGYIPQANAKPADDDEDDDIEDDDMIEDDVEDDDDDDTEDDDSEDDSDEDDEDSDDDDEDEDDDDEDEDDDDDADEDDDAPAAKKKSRVF
jgi:hypothetical protein